MIVRIFSAPRCALAHIARIKRARECAPIQCAPPRDQAVPTVDTEAPSVPLTVPPLQ